jgi:hypothetical protein
MDFFGNNLRNKLHTDINLRNNSNKQDTIQQNSDLGI